MTRSSAPVVPLAGSQRHDSLPYAGTIEPGPAWEAVGRGEAVLVDVRSAEERVFVGHVPGSVHVPWATGMALQRNPDFIAGLEKVVGRGDVLLFLCRSGKRSASAAEAATQAGFKACYNILEGFEGDLDPEKHRGRLNGWRLRGLPWVQE